MRILKLAPARIIAPAKVNLALNVVGRREDGLHLLDSLVVFGEPGDNLGVEVSNGADDTLAVTGPFGDTVPTGRDNILFHAMEFLRSELRATDIALPPLGITLEKNLPIASGIGGGSSDAAALIRHVAAHVPDRRAELYARSVLIGADVPMCCEAAPALVSGIGERVAPIPAMPPLSLLLVNPGVALSTAAVFKRLASPDNPCLPSLQERDLASPTSLARWLARTRNDLEAPAVALAAEIAEVQRALESAGALFARMSGSGATVFALFADDAALRTALSQLSAAHPHWWASSLSTWAGSVPRDGTSRTDAQEMPT